MSSQRSRIRVALALFASGVLGTSLIFACLHRDNPESIYDVIRADVIAGRTAQEHLQFAEAERHYRRVVEYTQSPSSDGAVDSEEHAWALVQLGGVLDDQGRYRDAERYYKWALNISNPTGNPYSEAPILPLTHLKNHYAACGDIARAEECRTEIDSIVTRVEPIYLNSIARQREMKGGDGSLLAEDLMTLANLYYARGESQRAEPLYAEVFAIRSKSTASDGDEVLAPLIRMGLANSDAGKDAAATEILKETLVVRESQVGPRSPTLVTNIYNLGMLAYRQNRLKEADSLLSRALAIEEGWLGRYHPHTAPILEGLADCKRDRGQIWAARACQMRVVEMRREVFGPKSHMVGAALLALAEIEAAAGDRVAARAVCEEALKVVRSASEGFDPLVVECESTLRRLSRYEPMVRGVAGKGEA